MRRRGVFTAFEKGVNKMWFAGSVALLRVSMGVMFLGAGLSKMQDWTAAGYLTAATGPLAPWFQSMAGSALIDTLNIWGLTCIGISLILGFLVRPAACFGIILMVLYYLSDFEGNTAHGYIDSHLIYSGIFLMMLSGGFGNIFGLNEIVKRSLRKKKGIVPFLLG